MKIEVGKSYINAEGDIVKILMRNLTLDYPYLGAKHSYTKQGAIFLDKESPQDLICEVVPEIYERYVLGYILTQEAFIEKHIEYWTEYEQNDL